MPLYVVIVWLSLATTVLILLNGILVGNLAVKIQNRGILILVIFLRWIHVWNVTIDSFDALSG